MVTYIEKKRLGRRFIGKPIPGGRSFVYPDAHNHMKLAVFLQSILPLQLIVITCQQLLGHSQIHNYFSTKHLGRSTTTATKKENNHWTTTLAAYNCDYAMVQWCWCGRFCIVCVQCCLCSCSYYYYHHHGAYSVNVCVYVSVVCLCVQMFFFAEDSLSAK